MTSRPTVTPITFVEITVSNSSAVTSTLPGDIQTVAEMVAVLMDTLMLPASLQLHQYLQVSIV